MIYVPVNSDHLLWQSDTLFFSAVISMSFSSLGSIEGFWKWISVMDLDAEGRQQSC